MLQFAFHSPSITTAPSPLPIVSVLRPRVLLAVTANIKVHIWLTVVGGGWSDARRLGRVMQIKQTNVSFWGSDALFVSSHETI